MKLFILSFILFISVSLNAQLGFFIEGGANVVSINQDAGINANISANLLVKHIFYAGVFYERLVTTNTDFIPVLDRIPTPMDSFETTRYYNQSTGVKTGFIILPNKLISISPEVAFGWTNVFWQTAKQQKDQYLNITPAIKAMVKPADWMRIGVSANYRYYTELKFNNNTPTVSTQKLGGIGGGLFLRFGNF